DLNQYFTRVGDVDTIMDPLDAVSYNRADFDISVIVEGGGDTGQRDSVSLGLARALLEMDLGNSIFAFTVSISTTSMISSYHIFKFVHTRGILCDDHLLFGCFEPGCTQHHLILFLVDML
ncbi:MAG: 30S ribosomal protein S9, partial [Thermoplasmata archaeon]